MLYDFVLLIVLLFEMNEKLQKLRIGIDLGVKNFAVAVWLNDRNVNRRKLVENKAG